MDSKGMVVSVRDRGDSFTISSADDDTYTIQVPNEDKVWTVILAGGEAAGVFLRPQVGAVTARWRFVPLDRD
ncbi:hypothetical protein C8R45DRAFT_1211248 [Mycena sanguinolenta]|nr:hypothetical protein C8R45DRAFT_1211248 [Mycena sanguinolenta]